MRKMSIGILVTLLLVLLSSGCYRTVSVKEVTPKGIESLAPDEALIFGRMRMIDNGKEKESYISTTEQLDIMLIRIEDEQALAVRRVKPDGTFLWQVPRGTYLLTRLRWWEFRGWFPIRPQIAFQVGPDAEAYYLGTLRIDADVERSALSVKIKRFAIVVADEYEQDVQLLTRELPSFQGRVEKALMVHDARIPAVTESEVNQSTIIGILRSLGFGLMTIH
ncbi:MAG TPA: hypothetical protein VL087_08250 [Nitrospirota bacterium]|nr:hypothetical protein [Nitrospirota bacterium]